jgi:hypothetical protein
MSGAHADCRLDRGTSAGLGGTGKVYLTYSPVGAPVAVKGIHSDRLGPVTRQ